MGTAKRERQKANRARREQELAREAAKSRTTRIVLIVGAAIVAVFALVYIAGQFVGDDDEQDPIPTNVVDTIVAEEPATDDTVAPSEAAEDTE